MNYYPDNDSPTWPMWLLVAIVLVAWMWERL